MAIINATGDAIKSLKDRFAEAQRHGRINRQEKLRIVCRHVEGDDNQYEVFCLNSAGTRLPIRPVQFRQLITDSTALPRRVRRVGTTNRYIRAR